MNQQTYFTGIGQLIRAYESTDSGHFFEAAALRYFNSRIGQTIYGGKYFVTSEKMPSLYEPEHPRLYTVRSIEADGDRYRIETIGDFYKHETEAQAVAAIRALIADQTVNAE